MACTLRRYEICSLSMCVPFCALKGTLVGYMCRSNCVLRHNPICPFWKDSFVLDEVRDRLFPFEYMEPCPMRHSEVSQFVEPGLILECDISFACKKLVAVKCTMDNGTFKLHRKETGNNGLLNYTYNAELFTLVPRTWSGTRPIVSYRASPVPCTWLLHFSRAVWPYL